MNPFQLAFIVLGLCAVAGNCLILTVIAKFPVLLKNDCFCLIALLAGADLITGAGSVIAGLKRLQVASQNVPYTKAECLLATAPMIWGMTAGQLLLLCIAADRLYATLSPGNYISKPHKTLAKKTGIATVIYSTALVLAMFPGVDLISQPAKCNAGASWSKPYRTYWALFTTVVGAVVVVLYGGVIVSMFQKKNETANSDMAERRRQRQRRVTKVAAMVLAGYVLFWMLPNTIYNVAARLGAPNSMLGVLGPLIGVGAGLNSSVNVLIYSFKHKEFKKKLYLLVGASVAKFGVSSVAQSRGQSRKASGQK